jgi:hypothetical protein
MTQGAVMRVVAQRRQKGQRGPAAVRHLGDQPRAAATAAMAAGHVGFGPSLVDEHQAPRVKPALMRLPPGPAAGDVGAILLAGVQDFFKGDPSCLKKRHTAP